MISQVFSLKYDPPPTVTSVPEIQLPSQSIPSAGIAQVPSSNVASGL